MCIQCGANTQLLHVFQEDFILGYKPQNEPEAYTPAFPCGEGIAPSSSENFFFLHLFPQTFSNLIMSFYYIQITNLPHSLRSSSWW